MGLLVSVASKGTENRTLVVLLDATERLWRPFPGAVSGFLSTWSDCARCPRTPPVGREDGRGRGFTYLDANGSRLNGADVARLKALAKSSYVDPRVVDLYEGGTTIASAVRRSYHSEDERQAALERAVLEMVA